MPPSFHFSHLGICEGTQQRSLFLGHLPTKTKQRDSPNTPVLVITSDQVIVCNGQLREKPESEAQCREFLRSYSLHPAEAIVGVVVTNTKTGLYPMDALLVAEY